MPRNLKVVHKYDLPMHGFVTHRLPDGFEVIHVETQAGSPRVWLHVPEGTKPAVQVRFRIIMTGEAIDLNEYTHIGTFMLGDGAYVAHAYQEKEWGVL